MGNNNIRGYRILSVKQGSPFDTKIQTYFDFIVDLITEPSPRQILDKLSGPEQKDSLTNMMIKIKQNINKPVKFKIFSTKTQTLRDVDVIPNNSWGGKDDLLGIQFRLEDPKLVRDNYCKISEVQMGSPASKARLSNDDYLIACQEIKYDSIQQLVDSMHEILYSKQILNKTVTFISYNIYADKIQSHKVQLIRKWGGKGIVGCEFLQGHIYRLPNNLQQIRKKYQQKYSYQKETRAIQKELLNSDGVSKRLAQNLKKKILKRQVVFKDPEPFKIPQIPLRQNLIIEQHNNSISNTLSIEGIVDQISNRFENSFKQLQKRVQNIQNFIKNLQQDIPMESVQEQQSIKAVHLHVEIDS